jgi:hypothetical protein
MKASTFWEICRKAGISPATHFSWKERYDRLLPTEMRRLRQLEHENAKLKKLVPIAQRGNAAGHDPPNALKPGRKCSSSTRCAASGIATINWSWVASDGCSPLSTSSPVLADAGAMAHLP